MFNQLTNMEQWRTLKFRSNKAPALIVKHSNTSPDSAETLQKIITAWQHNIITLPINLVVVQENREISNTIEKDLKIKHESPQIIVMLNGKAVYTASHNEIQPLAIAWVLSR